MDCEQIRVALSAMIDGETLGVPDPVRAHLAGCAECRAWLEQAHELTRRLRLAAAVPVPDLSDVIVARAANAFSGWWARGLVWVRVTLVGVAAGQVVLTVPPLLFGHDHAAPTHVAHELGSFGLALAVGFVAAAVRPGRARGMLPLLGVAALCLCGTAVADLVGGGTDLADESPHLLAVAGWLLVWLLAVLLAERPPATLDRLGWRRRWVAVHRGRSTGTDTVVGPSVRAGRRAA